MACGCISRKLVKISLWIILFTLAISIVVIVLFPTIYNAVLTKELTLNKGTIATDIWKDIPIPIYERLYFFNITNKEDFLKGGEPLSVTEVGPFTYKSTWDKVDLTWNPDSTVSYKEIRTYHFVPELSNGTEEDEIYTLNGPMIIATGLAKDYNVELRTLLSILLGILGEEFIIKKSIKELAYGGYEDFIIKFAPIMISDLPYKDGIFCWLYGKNATNDGLFTVFTGSGDSSKTGFLYEWNGQKSLQFWKGDSCNQLNGTSIEFGPPIHGYQQTYAFFQSFFCRSLIYNYTGDVSYFGVMSKRFEPTYSLFANSTENPDNYCFEPDKERLSGILDIAPCEFGAPVFVSYPHFYMADSSYLNSVRGLNPNKENHGSTLDIEPTTGFTVDTKVRFQINVEITKVEGILQTYEVREGIFPVLWVEVSLEITEHFANYLKSRTLNPKIIAYSVLGVLAALSVILAIIAFVVLCLTESVDDDDDPLLNAVEKEPNAQENPQKHKKTTSYGSVHKDGRGDYKILDNEEDDSSIQTSRYEKEAE